MSRLFLLSLIALIFSPRVYGQVRSLEVSVIDSLTQDPVGYASIKSLSKARYADCSQLGKAIIDVQINDTLEISRVGYFKKLVYLNSNVNSVSVALVQRIDSLESLLIKPLRSNWESSNFNRTSCRTINFSNDSALSQVVVKFSLPLGANGIQLNRIKFKQKAFAEDFIRLHIYKVNEIGLPGDDMLTEVIVVNSSHFEKGVVDIKLSPGTSYIEGSEFFVGLQWLTKKNPISNGRKNDIGIAETCSSGEATTFYQNFTLNGSWYQRFANGMRFYQKKTGEIVERKFKSESPIGNASNLMIELEGKIF